MLWRRYMCCMISKANGSSDILKCTVRQWRRQTAYGAVFILQLWMRML